MKKQTFLALLFSLVSVVSFAQKRGEHPGGERVKAVKIGMITEQLQLSESQAEKFWPIYNAYSEERMMINRQVREKTKRAANTGVSDEEVLKQQDEVLELKSKEIELVKQYRGSFLKVITAKQYADLLETERKFNQMLMEKLKERGRN